MQRKPIFGVLAVIAPLAGLYFWWRIQSDEAAAAGDDTGLGVPLAIGLYYGSCLLLANLFGVISLARRESPELIAIAGIGLAWLPLVVVYLWTHLF